MKFSILALCVAGLLAFTPCAQSNAAEPVDACTVSSMQTGVRPGAAGPPTRVSVGMFMVDLTEISDPNQTLTGDFAVALNWTDPRLAHLEGCEISLDDIWSPGLAFFNSGRLFTSRPREAGIGAGGSVTYAQRYFGTIASYHNLQDFPFDDQTFRVSLLPFEWTDKDVALIADETATGRRESAECFRLGDRECTGRHQQAIRTGTKCLCAPIRFHNHGSPHYGLLPLEGDPATVPDRRDVVVRILDQSGTLRPSDRPLGHLHADFDRIHLRHDQHGA